jgi:hypothetical protein
MDDDGGDDNSSTTTTTTDDESVNGAYVIAIIVCMLSLGWLWYYFGYVWSFTKFQYEFTAWFSPPAPGPIVDQRYNFQWIILLLPIFNLFPPFVGLWVLLKPTAVWRYDLHKICMLVAVIATGIALVYSILVIWILQNGSSVFPFSVANPAEYCCKYYASPHCHNFVDCVDLPTVPTIHLHTGRIFEHHILLGMPGCIVWLTAQLVVFSMVRNYIAYQSPSSSPSSQTRKQRGCVTALKVINFVYVMLLCVYFVFGLLVLDIRYSHEYPPTGPIGLQSGRTGLEAVGLVMSGGVVLVPAFVLLVMFLQQQRSYTGKVAVFVLIAALTVTHMFAFMTMMYSRGTGNQPGYPNSFANHPLRCCAGDVAANPLSQCDNPAAVCVFPVAAFPSFVGPLSSHVIPSNPVHTLIFVCMFLFLTMDAAILSIVFVAYLGAKKAAIVQAIGAWMPSSSSFAIATAYAPSGYDRIPSQYSSKGPSLLPSVRMPPGFARVFSVDNKTD